MTSKEIFVAVDRLEGSKAVLEADDGTEFIVPTSKLSPKPREGRVYRVPLAKDGTPDWPLAVLDAAEAKRRLEKLAAQMKKLAQRDTGEDIEL